MIVAFFLGPTADVFGNVGPVPESVHLGAFDEGEFLVGAPVLVEDRERVRRDDAVGVGGAVRTERLAMQEALYSPDSPQQT